MRALRDIHIGPAGWSYADWRGRVYPENAGAKVDTLARVAKYFDTAEINSSFYRPPSPATARSWLQRIAHNPSFTFTAKLYKVFTHERGKATAYDEKAFRAGLDPLFEAGKLGAVLMQFPWSFKNDREERTYLTQLAERFKSYPLVVELRHESWNSPRLLQTLEDLGVGLCNIDQPLFANSIKPSAEVTSPIGYVRLHGRNYQNWFREETDVVERYDYLYSRDELEPWVERIKEIAQKARQTYVITNNHARGQSLVNAFEVMALLEEQRMPGPAKLIESYPRLSESVEPDDESAQGELF
ncbi:MAG TPA: DUF72 domain-containing protein [Pyrinomonadaceae bacterium]|nr:DUF72 domain-containing protein [Pyrinomonadaceae bacterium]